MRKNNPSVFPLEYSRHIASVTLALIILLFVTVTGCRERDDTQRPNIIVVMVDDMGFSDIGCYGSEIPTPNIDKLGTGGIRFSNFYNAARCCPSRASLLTGLYPHQAGMGGMVDLNGRSRPRGPYQGWLSDSTRTIAEVLREAGYSTFMSGKWHVGEDRADWPLQRGFERYFGLISGANSYFEILPGRKIVSQNNVIEKLPDNFYLTDAITDSAAAYIRTGLSEKKPFFLYLAYTAPHWPLHAREDKISGFRGKYMAGWDSLRLTRHARQEQAGIFPRPVRLSERDSVIPAWRDVNEKEQYDLTMAVYAAMLASVDEGMGKLTQLLEQNGALENTIIFFLSDNGGCHETLTWRLDKDLGGKSALAKVTPAGAPGSYEAYGKSWANVSNTPFRMYKHWTHEGGISTPLIVYYPSMIKNGKVVHSAGHIMDIMPTCLELAQVDLIDAYDAGLRLPEGKSIVPVLSGQPYKGHEALYWEHEQNKAVRKGPWKLVSTKDGDWELYNLDADRTELNNLAGGMPDTVKVLETMYNQWASRVGVDKK